MSQGDLKKKGINKREIYTISILSPGQQNDSVEFNNLLKKENTIETSKSQQSVRKTSKKNFSNGNLFKRQLSMNNISKEKKSLINNKRQNLLMPVGTGSGNRINLPAFKSPNSKQMNITVKLNNQQKKLSCDIYMRVQSARLHRQRKKSWDYIQTRYPLLQSSQFMFIKQQQPLDSIRNNLKEQYIVFCQKTLKFKKLIQKDQYKINYEPIKHDNILSIEGRVKIYEEMYFVEDKKESVSIDQIVKKYHLPYMESYIKQKIFHFVNAMIFLHQREIIHNRISPKTIFISKNGDLLIDLLKISCEPLKQTQKVSNFYFLSPQLLKKDQISKKNDIWALGCLILYLSTGKIQNSRFHPYSESYCGHKTIEQLKLIKQLKLKYGKPSDSNPLDFNEQKVLSDEIKQIISHCLKINPKHRLEMIELNFNQEFLK